MLCLLGMASHGKVTLVACSRRRLTDPVRMAPDPRGQQCRGTGVCRLRRHLHLRIACLALDRRGRAARSLGCRRSGSLSDRHLHHPFGTTNRLMPVRTPSDPDHLPALDRRYAIERPALGFGASDPPPRILLLYGSLRERSFSRLCVEEASRLLQFFGCETRIYDPSALPLPDQVTGDDHPAVHELREL